MKVRVTAAAIAALARTLAEIGVRTPRSGSVTFAFDGRGVFEGWEVKEARTAVLPSADPYIAPEAQKSAQ